ncbi:MAG TPA: hypothetical protein VFN29_07505 [Chiayiivirga sp.]|nr:hypothetical protein [Chiayiivirga sp.]
MQSTHRLTRKPRLFARKRHGHASAILLLALSPTLSAAPANDGFTTELASVATPIAGTRCESSYGHADTSSAANQIAPRLAPREGRATLGWAVALLLAGIAVGRHSAKSHSEPV